MRFEARRRITDSGRSRVWYACDTLQRVPSWTFARHRDGAKNERDARWAVLLLNAGWDLLSPLAAQEKSE